MTEEKCERCDAELSYAVDGKTYSRKVGRRIPGVYDGVLFWECPYCAHTWQRWPEGSLLRAKALEHMPSEAA